MGRFLLSKLIILNDDYVGLEHQTYPPTISVSISILPSVLRFLLLISFTLTFILNPCASYLTLHTTL